MPKTAHPSPRRRDGLSLRGVNFEDALRAAMQTPIPKGWKPPKTRTAKRRRKKV